MVTALNTIVKDSLPEVMLPAPRASALGRGGHVPEWTVAYCDGPPSRRGARRRWWRGGDHRAQYAWPRAGELHIAAPRVLTVRALIAED